MQNAIKLCARGGVRARARDVVGGCRTGQIRWVKLTDKIEARATDETGKPPETVPRVAEELTAP